VTALRRRARATRQRLLAAFDRHLPALMLVPAALLVVGTVAYPLAWAFHLSLHRMSIFELGAGTYVGLNNYRALLAEPRFGRVVANTAVFVAASVAGQFGLGLGLSLLLDREWLSGRLARSLRATYLLPWAVAGVVVAYSWQFVYDPRVGLLAGLLGTVGVESPAWLSNVELAMVAVVVANVWQGTPFSLVFMTSALRSVPGRLREAAAVGGATRSQALRHVTLPHLRPFVAMNLLLITVFTVNTFDLIYVMTGGGPLDATEVLAVYTYDVAFDLGRFGLAAALAVVLFAVNAVAVAGYLFVLGVDR
jgi:multiple sugar transport system permease protein